MKNLKFILMAGLLTVVLVINRFAAPGVASKNEISVYKQLEQQMPYPEFAIKDQVTGKVIVEFRINMAGNIEVLNINYSDAALKSYVVERLSKLNLGQSDNYNGKVYRVAFAFNLLP
jgi:hypothetical protein